MMYNTFSFADALGRKSMASALGVGLKMISKAIVAGKFPASWFLIVNKLAAEREIVCPPCLFDFKQQAEISGGDAVPACQHTVSHTSAILPADL